MMLNDDEKAVLGHLQAKLGGLRFYHEQQTRYFEGSMELKSLGISTPMSREDIGCVVEWPQTVATSIAERINWRGWTNEALGLSEVARDALVGFEFSQAILEATIYGQGFLEVSLGKEDEPEVVVQAVSAKATTGLWNPRKHRLTAGYTTWVEDDAKHERLYTEDATVHLVDGEVQARMEHGWGRPTLVRYANRLRPSRPEGQSEITRSIRYFTDAAIRTIHGMEMSREFYVNPQRWAKNLFPEDFGIDPDAPPEVRRLQGWNAVTGSLLVAPPNEDGENVELGQFRSEGPSAFWESVRALSQMCAAVSGMPPSYFGFVTENPSSADAIRAEEARLVQRCEGKLELGSWASREVALLALLTRDEGVVDWDEFRKVRTQWADVATPTRAAAADAAQKLVAAQVLPADSQVTFDMVGLTDDQQETLAAEKKAAQVTAILDRVMQPVTPEAAAMANTTAGEQASLRQPEPAAAELEDR